MKYAITASSLLALANCAAVRAQDNNCYQENNNWYCSSVQAISYSNFGTPGQYQKVSSMGANQACSYENQAYSGGMAPFDGEISWHFRGPIQLKQFASYKLGSGNSKRSAHPNPQQRPYAHQHLHQHQHLDHSGPPSPKLEKGEHKDDKRAVGDWVTATINGAVVSWVNQYDGGAAPTSAPASAPAPAPSSDDSNSDQRVAPEAASPAPSAPAPATSMNAGSGNWGRQAYYNAQQGIADGLVFLNHHGGQGSGVFDNDWGMSLSYSSADNSAGSSGPVPLADTLIPDNREFVIMTDKPCSDGSCGTVRDGTVAYHGFDGASKLFLIEFAMPLSGNGGTNGDMPAIWMLNAQIPRTVQYGSCSCWRSGCGEFDVFEVLDPGNQKCKSTWHGNNANGDSNWFQRPVSGTQKAAVILDGSASTASVVLLPDDFNFDPTISGATIAASLNSISNSAMHIRVALPP